jgi:hypothetical protein
MIKATLKFIKGPAPAINIMSLLGFLSIRGSTGTGFAHPNAALLVRERIMGRIKVPMGSICTAGLRVIRPAYSAVLSPNRLAILA